MAISTTPIYTSLTDAISVSYGLSSERLPIGIQLVRKWLDEATLLRLGVMLERKGGLGDRRPTI